MSNFSYTGPLYQSTAEFQKFSGLSRDAIYKGLHEGSIPSIKVGKNFKINVFAYLEKLRSENGGR